MKQLILDLEVYRNYFQASFRNRETGNVRHFVMHEGHPLDVETIRKILRSYQIITFNGIGYDIPMLTLALGGATTQKIKEYSDKMIKNNMKHWQLGIEPVKCDHIDIIEVAPGIASLKIYGGRLHAPKIQDLPIEPDADITTEQRLLLQQYCENDLYTTDLLYQKLELQIKLREQMSSEYGIDLRSKSDAQIAEAVIRHEVEKLSGLRLPKEDPFRFAGGRFKYRFPGFLKNIFSPAVSEAVRVVAESEFVIGGNGVVLLPKEIKDLHIKIGGSTYAMGIGGLHSTEKSVAHRSDDQYILVDKDVASYYPRIILNCGLKPSNMGDYFTSVYNSIVERRLKAKRCGDKVTDSSLKITINGSFGKFGSPYSILYSPTLLIQTTITGQLSLLMLIERLEAEGISVVSANTDGIVIKCPRDKVTLMEVITMEWEHDTGFETEATEYLALYSRDVNNYIAIKRDGYKTKGVYAPAGLSKNPTTEIVSEAVIAYLRKGVPVDQTVTSCTDVRKFVSVRAVKGGAVKAKKRELIDDWVEIEGGYWVRKKWIDEGTDYYKRAVMGVDGDKPDASYVDIEYDYLGKAVRWYYAEGETGTINYKLNGNKVPSSDGARPLMELPDALPADLDFNWYIAEANSILKDIGAQ